MGPSRKREGSIERALEPFSKKKGRTLQTYHEDLALLAAP